MLTLGVESATDQCGCALADGGGLLAEVRVLLGRRHAEMLAPQVGFVCEQAGVTLSGLGAVAVDAGPGLYTGLRAGLATAQAIAMALGVPVAAVSSLEALAFGAAVCGASPSLTLSVIDARRGEVFWGWYSTSGEGDLAELTKPAVGAPEDLAAEIRRGEVVGRSAFGGAGRILVVGDGARRYAEVMGASARLELAGEELRFPPPSAVALLGRRRAVAGETLAPEHVEPVYLRPHDASRRAWHAPTRTP